MYPQERQRAKAENDEILPELREQFRGTSHETLPLRRIEAGNLRLLVVQIDMLLRITHGNLFPNRIKAITDIIHAILL